MTVNDADRISNDLREATHLLDRLPDDDPAKAMMQRRLIAITSTMKRDAPRARDRLERLLEELRKYKGF
ncbi:MAG TPA: hypothetical protein VJ649_10670 [Actinomycetes bacterium]|nr:hypothetical protein [Actinomycetes bacterium]